MIENTNRETAVARDPSLPPGVESLGQSPEFTRESAPDALRTEHRTAAGRWAVLEVLEGSLTYVALTADEARGLAQGEFVVIEPEQPHRVALPNAVRFQLRFFREKR